MSPNSVRDRASKMVEEWGIPGKIEKATIRSHRLDSNELVDYKFYAVLGFYPSDRLDYVEVFSSGLHTHNVRALLEMVCEKTRLLVRDGQWGLDTLLRDWRGRQFEPRGVCKQLQELTPDENPQVTSPLDALARIIEIRRRDW